mgnify:CR=1 FL=1
MKKVLIANRGEIAIRIARTCSDLGIRTVGIYSEDDANSLHLSKVDEAYQIEGKGTQAYLDIKQIISIAKASKVDFINPGYVFSSENSAFAASVKRAKIKFIGPSEKTLKIFGDKTTAKELAFSLDIPIISGTHQKTSLRQAQSFMKSLNKK